MNKKNTQKLNRAAVAAVLAVSGAAVSMPYAVVKADTPFKDLTTSNSHYDAIMQLYNRDIISGYSDGTFRPSKHVTRGQAAKMLASILGLELSNVKNPKFKDVTANNSYYAYIAALVELDVMSGYKDGTFRPNEVITRNQMAKIIVRGFQFGEAKELTHTFEDVTPKNANRFYIQTLLDLNITQGTSAITYSPSKAVTRGQLASFLIRAEKANVHGASVKEVTKVEQVSGKTYVYLNGVKHTVHTNLRDILHIRNTEILMGAHIDATIVGTEIRALNKITFNANGATNNVLTFDGNNSTFRGVVEITGNHLRFANWNVTGEVNITPVQHEVFSNVISPLQVKTIAALKFASDIIDWGTITPPSVTQPDENDGLVDIPTDNKPSLPKLKTVEHDIQFVNVTIRALHITANRTKVRSNIDLAHVTVSGYVREFELHFDIGELYLQSDDNVTFYGVSDIEKLFKNTYKSVNLYADSITELLAVDNAYGWIDLGDYYYADKVVIPPNKLPYEIFNDFLNDSDKIGNIEDTSGKEIDRDPIENTIIPDQEAPTLLIKDIKTNLATANITVNANEDGTVHYLVKKENDGEPSIREIMQYTGSMGGNKAVSAGQDSVISLTNLKDEQKYIFYAVAVDEAGNISIKKSEAFEVLDATPPNINPAKATGIPGGTRIEVEMTPDEPGEYFYYYEPMPILGPNQYTAQEILDYANLNYRGQGGKGTVTVAGPMDFRITGLTHLTNYVVYVVMKDKYGNTMAEPKVLTAMTTELDVYHPFIPLPGELKRVNPNSYDFYFEVSEVLDPITANDPNNYELSGTAILNYEGQQTTIKPEYVKYEAGSKRVTIRVPSATALVLGDTIEIKVLPGVTDLAENEFINLNVTGDPQAVLNIAKYAHINDELPTLDIENFIKDPAGKTAQLTFKANKAGTYYYMIVPNSYTTMPTNPRDFYDEFTSTNTPWTPVIPHVVKQGDTGNNTVLVGSQMINVNLPDTSATPFESYSLYMVLKDRSGQLTSIEKIENIIDDSRAPFIRSLDVSPVSGTDTSVKILVNSSESGSLFYKRLEKYQRDANGDFVLDEYGKKVENPEIGRIEGWQEKLSTFKGNINIGASDADISRYISEIRSWSNSAIRAGLSEPIFERGLSEHTEYVYFFAAADSVGNLTVFQSNSTTLSATEDYNSTAVMKEEVYTDGKLPTVDKILKNALQSEFEDDSGTNVVNWGPSSEVGDKIIEYIPHQTFKATFSEALSNDTGTTIPKPQNDTAVLSTIKAYIEEQTGSGSVKDIEWQNTTNIGTHEERMLVITFNNVVTNNITLKMNDAELLAIKDLSGKDFFVNEDNSLIPGSIARYEVAIAKTNEIGSAFFMASDSPIGDGITFSSKIVYTQLEIGTEAAWNQNLYYVATNSDKTALTADEVDKVIKSIKSNSRIFLTGIPIYGSEALEGPSKLYTLNVADMPGYTSTDYFHTDQNLFIFTIDHYGNIVWATDKQDKTKLYRKINYPAVPPTTP